MRQSKIKKIAKDVIKIETEAVSKIEDRIDDIFESAVNQILDCRGRLIVMGMGKSGLISQKIAAYSGQTCESKFSSVHLPCQVPISGRGHEL